MLLNCSAREPLHIARQFQLSIIATNPNDWFSDARNSKRELVAAKGTKAEGREGPTGLVGTGVESGPV